MINTYATTKTMTRTRTDVIDDQFKIFFVCAGMSDTKIEKMLRAVEEHKLQAVGIYIEDKGYMLAEVSISVDWEAHARIVLKSGKEMDTDIAGWKDGVAPEAYIPVQSLSKKAKELGKPLRSWIRVSEVIRQSATKHKAVCDELGYCYGSSTPAFKEGPLEKSRNINELEEVQITAKSIPNF